MSPLASQDCNRKHPHPCCYNQYLDEFLNSCQECPFGTFGWNCKFNCSMGFYGRLCQVSCECVSTECHYVTGCIGGSSSSLQMSNTVQTFSWQSSSTTVLYNNTDRLNSHYSRTEIIHHSHGVSITVSLIGSLVSFLILGCIFNIWSRKKKSRRSFGVEMKYMLIPCADSDVRRLPTTPAAPAAPRSPRCGVEEGGLYDEVRYSQFVDRGRIMGSYDQGAASSLTWKDECVKGRHPQRKDRGNNIYQKCVASNDYDHLHLKMKRSTLVPECVAQGKAEEYFVLNEGKQLQKSDKIDENFESQSLKLLSDAEEENGQKSILEEDSDSPLSREELQRTQLLEEGVIEQHTERITLTDTSKQTVDQIEKRPYSLVRGSPSYDLTGEEEEKSRLLNTDLPDIEKQAEYESSKQTGARPYSFAQLLE